MGCSFLLESVGIEWWVSPLERGLRGVLRREVQLGKRYCDEVFLELRVVAFDLSGCARASHTPVPSREGRLGCSFLLESVGIEW